MSAVFSILDIVGILSFSATGAIKAIDRENDIVGVILLSYITAFGGGILRDILIGINPPTFFAGTLSKILPFVTAIVIFILAKVFKRQYVRHEKAVDMINNYFDALGLAGFVISGATMVINLGHTDAFLVLTLGILSGTGGSVIRDILLRDVPYVLHKRVYVFAALLGLIVFYSLYVLEVPLNLSMIIGATVIVAVRVLSTTFKWNMPKAIIFSELNK